MEADRTNLPLSNHDYNRWINTNLATIKDDQSLSVQIQTTEGTIREITITPSAEKRLRRLTITVNTDEELSAYLSDLSKKLPTNPSVKNALKQYAPVASPTPIAARTPTCHPTIICNSEGEFITNWLNFVHNFNNHVPVLETQNQTTLHNILLAAKNFLKIFVESQKKLNPAQANEKFSILLEHNPAAGNIELPFPDIRPSAPPYHLMSSSIDQNPAQIASDAQVARDLQAQLDAQFNQEAQNHAEFMQEYIADEQQDFFLDDAAYAQRLNHDLNGYQLYQQQNPNTNYLHFFAAICILLVAILVKYYY